MEVCEVVLGKEKKKKEKLIHSEADITLLFFELLKRKLTYLHNTF